MTERLVTVSLKEGLDARGVALCVQLAGNYQSTVHFTEGFRKMNAKSIMGMMALGLKTGDSVLVQAEGPDEEEAVQALADFVEGK